MSIHTNTSIKLHVSSFIEHMTKSRLSCCLNIIVMFMILMIMVIRVCGDHNDCDFVNDNDDSYK